MTDHGSAAKLRESATPWHCNNMKSRSTWVLLILVSLAVAVIGSSRVQAEPDKTDAPATRVVPSFRDKKMNGLKVFQVNATDWFGRNGVQSGDIVRRINGCEVAPKDRADKLMQRAQKSRDHLAIEVLRKGELYALDHQSDGSIKAEPVSEFAGDRASCADFLR